MVSGVRLSLPLRHGDFAFGIGGTDTVSLFNDKMQLVDTVELKGNGTSTTSYKRVPDGVGDWKYTTPHTPGQGLSLVPHVSVNNRSRLFVTVLSVKPHPTQVEPKGGLV